ncbi:hypothetical protein G3N18_01820 [Microbacterium sp. 2C]|uniref:hypothetical protein n=1 Tax=Microbacterium paulum TaxID=2707006 RepID=UPI0018C1DE19|nr:hypothetical protein [Microbacterium paulum]MBG0716824.1 hypothetical protein [Microbacterium paulum]
MTRDTQAADSPTRGWWLIVSAIALVVALVVPLWTVPELPDPATAAAWILVIGVIVNGAGMSIRAGVHGAQRGTFMALMDGVGKVLSLIGWSSTLFFVTFNALNGTDANMGVAIAVVIWSVLGIALFLFVWGVALFRRSVRARR